MHDTPPLASLGRRIMICGPSNTGKSTLAVAIGNKLGLPAIHLDRLRHTPHTDWQLRPDPEFFALHDAEIVADAWVMDGNYSKVLPQRLARATSVILTMDNRWASLFRYFRRTLFERQRAGALDGTKDSIKWNMIHWIIVRSPASQKRYRRALRASGVPILEVRGMAELNHLYTAWDLTRG